MITVKLEGMDRLKAKLLGVEKQVRFAEMVAINRAAFTAREAVQREIGRVFDRPTPWVKGAVRVIKATKAKPTAQVDLDFWGNKQGVSVDQVLKAQIGGGARKNKRNEIALQRAGILPAGMGIVPGSAAKLDQYGNMQAGQIVQIISWFKAAGEQGYSANMKDGGKRLGRDNKRTGARGFAYFALQKAHGKLLPGVYQRIQTAFGSAVKPVMIFVRMPAYKQRLDFYGVADRAARAEFAVQFPIAFKQAMATAR
jgi:hypothetical protein